MNPDRCYLPRFLARLLARFLARQGHFLAVWGGRYLAERFGTVTMEPAEMTGWITNVELPMRDGDQMGRIKAKLLGKMISNSALYIHADA